MRDSHGRSSSRARTRRSSGIADLEELFHLLIENVRDYAIFILDPHGHALTWNVGVQRLLGYDEREFLGLHFRTLFRGDDQDGATREMEKATAVGRSEDERWHVRKDGSERWITGVLTALRDPAGELRGFAKIMRDSTAQRAAALEREDLLQRELHAREQAEEANKAKDTFLATVSHELRTPLNAMLGWARMLASGQLDEMQRRRAADIIDRNARAQAQLVAELLDVSRIATGKLQLNVQRLALHTVIATALESVQHAAAAKDITISTAMKGSLPPIDGDPDRLLQVLLNLLSNAIKFTPARGEIDVTLTADRQNVHVTVRDTGRGIAPDLLPRIFDRFQQGDRIEGPTSGLGLGLTIARHIVESHHGTIEAHSEGDGKGATVVVRLPRAHVIVAGSDVQAPGSPEIEQPRELRGKCALIIEDQQDSQSLVAFVLERAGMRILTAESAQDALSFLNTESVDVIVSDIRLSGESDGLELIREVRAQSGAAGRVPALVVTGYADPDDRVRALSAGYDLHLAKPVDPAALIKAITALLR